VELGPEPEGSEIQWANKNKKCFTVFLLIEIYCL